MNEFITRAIIYFAGIIGNLGLILNNKLIVSIGITPLTIFAIYWFYQDMREMKNSKVGTRNSNSKVLRKLDKSFAPK